MQFDIRFFMKFLDVIAFGLMDFFGLALSISKPLMIGYHGKRIFIPVSTGS